VPARNEVESVEGRAFLIQVGDKRRKDQLSRLDTSMRELRELARTAGVGVVDVITQVRDGMDPKYVMGRGSSTS